MPKKPTLHHILLRLGSHISCCHNRNREELARTQNQRERDFLLGQRDAWNSVGAVLEEFRD